MPRVKRLLRRSLDTEVTGVDLYHGAAPYFVTMADPSGVQFWEWDVDPETRIPLVPESDLEEIQAAIDEADELILQNPAFDARALQVPAAFAGQLRFPWEKVRDTLMAAHLLASNQPKDLTTLALYYLRINIQPYEDAIEKAVKEARALVKNKYPHWRIAREGLPDMPSAKAKVWKYDMWLPRAVAKAEDYPEDHPWWTVLRDYGNVDAEVTSAIYEHQIEEITKRGLVRIYETRLKLLPIIVKIEDRGLSMNRERSEKLLSRFSEESEVHGRRCINIAKSYGYDLKLPKSGNNNSLLEFAFDVMKLQVVRKTDTGQPSLNKKAFEDYQATLRTNSKELRFIENLLGKRKRDTAAGYLQNYMRFWIPLGIYNKGGQRLWYRIHPSLNPTGTDTLRWSSSNPNEQNVSKQEGVNIREALGPLPGREWWSCDAKNIELRLPAYEAGEEEMIRLFEDEDAPPYYGSYHMLIFDTLHPEKFAKYGMDSKKVYASTWYQWTKNGNFAIQYGAVESSGTADAAYHVKGAQRKIQNRFKAIARLSQAMIDHANRYGYVETIPDKSVDPTRGYPLLCTRTAWGKILPTVPLSYHVQGSAMWWMMMAMIRVQAYLDELNRNVANVERDGYFIVAQVHDELVFDFPKGTGPEPWKTNLPIMLTIKSLMEEGGKGFGIPTPVGIEYHADNWAVGMGV